MSCQHTLSLSLSRRGQATSYRATMLLTIYLSDWSLLHCTTNHEAIQHNTSQHFASIQHFLPGGTVIQGLSEYAIDYLYT